MTVVQHKYHPRPQLLRFHARTQRWVVIVAHRRFGKTVGVVNDLIVRALRTQKKNAFYAYIAPYFGQAKQAAWMYIKDAVRSIPGVKVKEGDVSVVLPNGATIRVFGADNYDALRGLYFDGVVLDEFGDMDSRAWTEVIRPALGDRQGWAVFIGTPRGKNKFYEMRERARTDTSGKWLYIEIKASESSVLPHAELEDARAEMDADEYAQEFECSFDATIRGSYYGKHIAQLEDKGLILYGDALKDFYDPLEPVSIAHDPGRDDAWAMWFWQCVNGEIRIIDYWEESGYDAEEVLDVLELKPYSWETWWVPHDALHRTAQSKKSILDQFREANAPARKVPNPDGGAGQLHGVNAVRKVLRTYPLKFDGVRCARGIEALKNYSRKWNADTKVFSETPKHDQWSHGADAFRYFALSVKPEDIQRSVDRYRNRRIREARGERIGLQDLNTPEQTLNEMWHEHDRRLRAQRSMGRQRV